MSGVADDLLVRARSTLLDALIALREHRDSIVVIGAQAVYLHTGRHRSPLPKPRRTVIWP